MSVNDSALGTFAMGKPQSLSLWYPGRNTAAGVGVGGVSSSR